ncbi:MAG: hypothetical protein ACOYKO_00570 [Rhodoluna sp.]|jgi:hypothetical protein
MFDDLKSVMLRVLKLGSLLVLGITLLGSGIGFLVAGQSGVLAAITGGGAAFVFTALTALSLLLGSKLGLGGFLGVVLGGWLIKMVLFLVLFSALTRADWLTFESRPVVFFTVVAAVIGGLVLDTLIVTKARLAPAVKSS